MQPHFRYRSRLWRTSDSPDFRKYIIPAAHCCWPCSLNHRRRAVDEYGVCRRRLSQLAFVGSGQPTGSGQGSPLTICVFSVAHHPRVCSSQIARVRRYVQVRRRCAADLAACRMLRRESPRPRLILSPSITAWPFLIPPRRQALTGHHHPASSSQMQAMAFELHRHRSRPRRRASSWLLSLRARMRNSNRGHRLVTIARLPAPVLVRQRLSVTRFHRRFSGHRLARRCLPLQCVTSGGLSPGGRQSLTCSSCNLNGQMFICLCNHHACKTSSEPLSRP